MHLEFMADDSRSSLRIDTRDFLPIHLRNKIGDWAALNIRLQPQITSDGLIEIQDAAGLIKHQDAVFDRVEEPLQEAPLPRQALDDGLQSFGIKPADAAQNFIEKTGIGSHGLEDSWVSGQLMVSACWIVPWTESIRRRTEALKPLATLRCSRDDQNRCLLRANCRRGPGLPPR